MKQRVTATINQESIQKLDSMIDGMIIRNRSHALEICVKDYVKKKVKI